MPRVAEFEESVVTRARNIVASTQDARELRKALCVVLVAVGGLTSREAADVLGVGIATVGRHQRDVRAGGTTAAVGGRPRWGGRRRELMTIDQERQFLAQWTERAETGGVLVVPPIHRALENRLGHKVAATTVYRILARHGWRKVEPEPHHPKRDPEAQEAFKKTGRKCWRRIARRTSSRCQ